MEHGGVWYGTTVIVIIVFFVFLTETFAGKQCVVASSDFGDFLPNCEGFTDEVCQYDCKSQVGHSYLTTQCLPSGEWYPNIGLLCTGENIGCPKRFDHGEVSAYCNAELYELCAYSCFNGYTDTHRQSLQCTYSGHWDTDVDNICKKSDYESSMTTEAKIATGCTIGLSVIVLGPVVFVVYKSKRSQRVIRRRNRQAAHRNLRFLNNESTNGTLAAPPPSYYVAESDSPGQNVATAPTDPESSNPTVPPEQSIFSNVRYENDDYTGRGLHETPPSYRDLSQQSITTESEPPNSAIPTALPPSYDDVVKDTRTLEIHENYKC